MNAILSGINRSARQRFRILNARVELLEQRVEHLEETVQSTVPPLPLAREQLDSLIGTSLTVHVCSGQQIQGILLSVQPDFLELMDQEGRRVMIPTDRMTAIDLK